MAPDGKLTNWAFGNWISFQREVGLGEMLFVPGATNWDSPMESPPMATVAGAREELVSGSSRPLAEAVAGAFSEYTIPEMSRAQTAAPKAPATAGLASSTATRFCHQAALPKSRPSTEREGAPSPALIRAMTSLEKLLK